MLCIVTMYWFGVSVASEKVMLNKYLDPLPEIPILKQFVFTNAPKHWNIYVKKLMEYSIKRVITEKVLRKESSIKCLPHDKTIFNIQLNF